MIRKTILDDLLRRLREKRRFLQVLAGPRQVGKTTLARQVMEALKLPAHYASADEPTLRDRTWIEQQWDIARLKIRGSKTGGLLILDEIQKVQGWSDIVKLLWDTDTHAGVPLKVVLLGSSPLLIQSGLTESLAGRFEIIPVPHWSLSEMREAFGWDLEKYIFFGAYPGAAPLIEEPERWRNYIIHSLIETTISRDILLMTRVDKPALLRRMFQLGCDYSGQILSYQKMLGQLLDAGNTVTLAHYLQLLHGAGMVAGLSKYAHGLVRQRGSSPKLQVLNTALMTAQSGRSLREARQDGDYWGRLVESSVGAHLLNSGMGGGIEVAYWRERNQEVDFVLHQGKNAVAIEVKSGRRRESLSGMDAFAKQFRPKRKLLVGGQGIPLEEFLLQPAAHWLQ
ncbi:MAG: ATP-binding protein [Verrucomicrobia bacterium]|nr:ATP-binding protein [Verrucomicrobiota bacterium]